MLESAGAGPRRLRARLPRYRALASPREPAGPRRFARPAWPACSRLIRAALEPFPMHEHTSSARADEDKPSLGEGVGGFKKGIRGV